MLRKIDQYPILIRPEGASRTIAIGTTGIVCRSSTSPDQVIKGPLKYELRKCDAETRKATLHDEKHNLECFEREKAIYRALPKSVYIIDAIVIKDESITFPFLRLGNLRDYLELHNKDINGKTRARWIGMAVAAVSLLHSLDVIHADISARNFLVADDLSIKLCDFSGSAMGDQLTLVREEARCCMAPDLPRSAITDLFALGCVIYEITMGVRPYNEIPDDEIERVEHLYSMGEYPSLEGNPYKKIIYKCWTCQYTDVGQLQHDQFPNVDDKNGEN